MVAYIHHATKKPRGDVMWLKAEEKHEARKKVESLPSQTLVYSYLCIKLPKVLQLQIPYQSHVNIVLQSLFEGLPPQSIFTIIDSIMATWYCLWHARVRQEGCKSRASTNKDSFWHAWVRQEGCESGAHMSKDCFWHARVRQEGYKSRAHTNSDTGRKAARVAPTRTKMVLTC